MLIVAINNIIHELSFVKLMCYDLCQVPEIISKHRKQKEQLISHSFLMILYDNSAIEISFHTPA